jgi:hypothetical protein
MLAAIAILGLVVMLLWNAVVPGVFPSIRALGYGQSLGLLILSRLLFGGWGNRGGFGGRRWQRLESLTPEERARFRSGGCRSDQHTEAHS